MKTIFALGILFLAVSAPTWAAKPSIQHLKPQVRQLAVSEQIKLLQGKLEQDLKRKLSPMQVQRLRDLVAVNESVTLIPVGDLRQDSTKLYCHGLQADFGINQVFAACYHLWTLRRYEMNLYGHGLSLHVAYSLFAADITYPIALADRQDPLHAEFEVTKGGVTLIGGRTWIQGHGDQGQKIQLEGYNLGLGVDSTPSAKINLRATR